MAAAVFMWYFLKPVQAKPTSSAAEQVIKHLSAYKDQTYLIFISPGHIVCVLFFSVVYQYARIF